MRLLKGKKSSFPCIVNIVICVSSPARELPETSAKSSYS